MFSIIYNSDLISLIVAASLQTVDNGTGLGIQENQTRVTLPNNTRTGLTWASAGKLLMLLLESWHLFCPRLGRLPVGVLLLQAAVSFFVWIWDK